jgi:Tfp pilus assembly protein PilN
MTVCNINLIAGRRAQKQRAITVMRCAIYSLIALFVGVALIYGWMTAATRLTAGEIAEIDARLTDPALTEAVDRIHFLDANIAKLEPRLRLLEKVHSSEEAWIQILRDIAGCTPRQVWITQLSSRRQDAKQTISLRGSAYRQRDIGEFMLQLDKPAWSGPPELGVSRSGLGTQGRRVIEFEVSVPLTQMIGSELR